MQFIETKIPGCYEIIPKIFKDIRGSFIKTFHQGLFTEQGLEANFVESYYSISQQRTLRGIHFQLPPHDHVKLVYCVKGEVLDVLVDLRLGSPVYGIPVQFQLSFGQPKMLYIAKGVGHGFYTLSKSAIMSCATSTLYKEDNDSGISWDSFSIWPDSNPILSKKDSELVYLNAFNTPFRLQKFFKIS